LEFSDTSKAMSYRLPKINRTALTVAAVCLFGSAASNYLLYLDLRSDYGISTGDVLASISRIDGEVRRRRASSFIWNPVNQGTELFLRDAVRGPSLIEFKNGTQMELGEESSIVIENLQNLELAFLRGSVIVSDTSGTKRITVDRDGKRTTESVPVRLIEPRVSQTFLAPPKGQALVPFRWFSPEPSGLFVEIAKDPAFKTLVKRSASGTEQEALPAGRYFWRVQKGDRKTEVRWFTVVEYPQVALTSPGPLQKIETIDENAAVTFRWSHASRLPESIAASFRLKLEVAENPEFSPVLLSREVLASAGRASANLASGKRYFWRVASADSRLDMQVRPAQFAIVPKEILPLELLQPAAKASIPWSPKLRLGWAFESPAEEFLVQVRQNGMEVFSRKTRTTNAEWSQPPIGVFQWRVTALLRGRTVGEAVEQSFEILPGRPVVLKKPDNQFRFEFWKEKPKLVFEWEHHALSQKGTYYLWELSKSADFEKITLSRKTTAPSLTESAPLASHGIWYWRIRLMDESSRLLSASLVKSFFWGPPPVLRSVAGAFPEPGTEVELGTKGKLPTLKWEPLSDAAAYEVAIRNKKKVVWSLTVKQPETSLPTLLEGDYWWTVRAIDLLGRKGEPLLQREMRVRYGRRLPAPEVVRSRVR
jgi:hypothetical protein